MSKRYAAALLGVLVAAGCAASSDLSRPATAPIGREPGEAQGEVASTREAITEFTRRPDEERGVWLASKDLLGPRDQLVALLDRLQQAGFKRVMICTQFRGYVLYPGSDVLPQHPDLKGEDLLRVVIDACHQRGMKADAWLEYGMYAYFTPDANDPSRGVILDADPSLTSLDARGNAAITRSFGTFYSMCPANPKSHDVLARLVVEVATKYDVDAVNLDRIRFASGDHMSLVGRERFERETGLDYDAIEPEDDRLVQWKRQQTLAAVRTIDAALEKAKPGMMLTSYVVPPDEKDEKGQSWDLWMREDLLDALAVSMYGADIEADANKAIKLLDGRTDKLIAAISSERATSELLTNVEMSRRLGLIGQYVWHASSTDEADATALRRGPWTP